MVNSKEAAHWPDPGAQPVTRGEFESRLGDVLTAIKALSTKFDEQSKSKQWSVGQILAVVAVLGTPLAFTIRTLYQTESNSAALSSHLDFSEKKSADLDIADALARERLRALETGLVAVGTEGETQNLWMADVINLERQHADILRGARCHSCSSGDIDFPSRDYWSLDHIGQANIPGAHGGSGQ